MPSSAPESTRSAPTYDFTLDLPHLRFPSSQIDGGFVVRVTSIDDGKTPEVVLELESKRLKAKWEGRFQSPMQFNPRGVELPLALVFSKLKAALEAKGQPPTYCQSVLEGVVPAKWLPPLERISKQTTTTVVDLTNESYGVVTLRFSTKIFDEHLLAFPFTLKQVAVSSLDVLNAKLSDVQADIIRLERTKSSKMHCMATMALVLLVTAGIFGLLQSREPMACGDKQCKMVCFWPYIGVTSPRRDQGCKHFVRWCAT